jgi:histidine ammonia-lyase
LRHLAAPLTIDPQPGAALVEDDSSNAPAAARRTARMLERLRYVLAIEALVATQAVDLAAPGAIGRGPAALHRAVRSRVARLDEDRSSADDVEHLAAEVFGVRTLAELLGEA